MAVQELWSITITYLPNGRQFTLTVEEKYFASGELAVGLPRLLGFSLDRKFFKIEAERTAVIINGEPKQNAGPSANAPRKIGSTAGK